jgi:hypothetical protein
VALAAAVGGVAYWMGLQAARSSPAADAAAGARTPLAALPLPAMQPPANHPPVTAGAAPAAAASPLPERRGKVTVDPNAKFVHFRVGNRNVKDILADGSVMWVGTSGGVIRYDT